MFRLGDHPPPPPGCDQGIIIYDKDQSEVWRHIFLQFAFSLKSCLRKNVTRVPGQRQVRMTPTLKYLQLRQFHRLLSKFSLDPDRGRRCNVSISVAGRAFTVPAYCRHLLQLFSHQSPVLVGDCSTPAFFIVAD